MSADGEGYGTVLPPPVTDHFRVGWSDTRGWLYPPDQRWPCSYCCDLMPPRVHVCPKPRCRRIYAYFNAYLGRRGNGCRRAQWYGDCGRGPMHGLAELVEFLKRMASPQDDYTREFAKRYAHRRLK